MRAACLDNQTPSHHLLRTTPACDRMNEDYENTKNFAPFRPFFSTHGVHGNHTPEPRKSIRREVRTPLKINATSPGEGMTRTHT